MADETDSNEGQENVSAASAGSALACIFCGSTPITDGDVLLLRVNPKGEVGKWLCATCIEANLETLTDDDGIAQPNFVHSPDCPSYCDYACNHWGFEMAEQLKSGGLDSAERSTSPGRRQTA